MRRCDVAVGEIDLKMAAEGSSCWFFTTSDTTQAQAATTVSETTDSVSVTAASIVVVLCSFIVRCCCRVSGPLLIYSTELTAFYLLETILVTCLLF